VEFLKGPACEPEEGVVLRWLVTAHCRYGLSYAAFELPEGEVAEVPMDGSMYDSGTHYYHVENPAKKPFHSIKFEAVREGIKDGESEVFAYRLPSGAHDPDEEIRIQLKAGRITETITLSPEGCSVDKTRKEPRRRGHDRDRN
jgi:hypothetical protein